MEWPKKICMGGNKMEEIKSEWYVKGYIKGRKDTIKKLKQKLEELEE